MKLSFKYSIAWFILLLGIIRLSAQENPLKIKGNLLTDQRFRLQEDNQWSWNENRLNLQLEKKIPGDAKFHSEIWLRNIGFPSLFSSTQLNNKDLTSSYNIDFREAYVELYGFLFEDLDIRIGRQRIAWGAADKLNPTDNLNAYDMEDIWDFGRHHGSDAIKMTYYINDYSLEGVYIPFFRPVTLPMGDWAAAFNPEMTLPMGMILKSFSDTLITPQHNLKESAVAGLKFGGLLLGYNFSLSYVYGRDGLPLANYNTFTPVDTLGGVNIKTSMFFPRMHIIGADLAGSIGSIGIWAEGAAFIPDEAITMSTDLSAFYPMSPVPVIQDTIILEDKPYFKFVIGTDYTFGDGSYLNFQYLHGFIHERGKDAINDYFMAGFEKKFFDEQLKLTPLAGGFIVADWEDIKNNYAFIYAPMVSYYPNDNAEINFGVRLLEGKGNNMFASVKDKDEFFFKLKYSF